MLNRNGKNNENGSFDWEDALIDAAIMSGSSFMAVLVGLGAVGLLENPTTALLAALIAAGAQFFAILAIKRRLVEE
jgi:hypothetical protein